MSTITYSEVLRKAVECGGTLEEAASVIEWLQLDIVAFDQRRAADAARLFPKTRRQGLSFADRACLAVAIDAKATLYTADQRLAELDLPVRVVLIRQEVRLAAKKK